MARRNSRGSEVKTKDLLTDATAIIADICHLKPYELNKLRTDLQERSYTRLTLDARRRIDRRIRNMLTNNSDLLDRVLNNYVGGADPQG